MSKKVVRHPSSPPTPDLLLRDVLDKVDHIKTVLVCGVYENEQFFAGWSEQLGQEVAFTFMQLQAHLLDCMKDD